MQGPRSRAAPELRALAELVVERGKLLVLTGAGCSTASGIPEYRGPDGRWRHSPPIRLQEFLRNERARRRYWARSLIGWPRVQQALPNSAHRAPASLEGAGIVHQVVTQNVDGLHQRAGHRRVVDLHGRLDRVDCLSCRVQLHRAAMQALLEDLIPQPFIQQITQPCQMAMHWFLSSSWPTSAFRAAPNAAAFSSRPWSSSARMCRGPGWSTYSANCAPQGHCWWRDPL